MTDGTAVGSPVTSSPYAIQWDSTTVTNGSHTVTAKATDTSGNTTTSAGVSFTVSNPAPPPPACFIKDADVRVTGRSSVTSPAIHDGVAGETIVAEIQADGPSGAGSQSITSVTASGLTFTLVDRANAVAGDAEVWVATAPTVLTDTTVKASAAKSGYYMSLEVFAMQGTHGVGAHTHASALTGAPSVNLTTSKPTSLVFMVGHDWDAAVARGLPAGWIMEGQYLSPSSDTMWNQYTNQPTRAAGSVVQAYDTSPTNDRWDVVAFELINDDV
jgi:hypothetical protein